MTPERELRERLEAHEFRKFYLGAGCVCGWRTQLMHETDCWPAWVGHIAALAAAPVLTGAPDCCLACGGTGKAAPAPTPAPPTRNDCCCNASWLDLDQRDCPIHGKPAEPAVPELSDKDGWLYDPDAKLKEIRAAMGPVEREPPFRKVVEWLHHRMAAAQNLPYEEGDVCLECADAVRDELRPLMERALAAAPRAAGGQREYIGTDGRAHFRVTGGNCVCGWTIINDFEWEQHLKSERIEPQVMAIRCMKHREVGPLNTNEASGAECAVCELEADQFKWMAAIESVEPNAQIAFTGDRQTYVWAVMEKWMERGERESKLAVELSKKVDELNERLAALAATEPQVEP